MRLSTRSPWQVVNSGHRYTRAVLAPCACKLRRPTEQCNRKMWQKSDGWVVAELPRRFTADSMYGFIGSVVDDQRDARCTRVSMDFTGLQFIDPAGVVVLSNLIEYFGRLGVTTTFVVGSRSMGTTYLDDAGFFERYTGQKLSDPAALRSTTVPLQLIHSRDAQSYLHFRLMPWIAEAVNLTAVSLASLRAIIEEIFHNVKDHSGVDIGCTFAQHFPRDRTLQIAVSDFGCGVPDVVRLVQPDAGDLAALRLACKEGFTSKPNGHNRGAGIPNLIRFVTQKARGSVTIASGRAVVTAAPAKGGPRLTFRAAGGWYPGTLVRVILPTDRLPDLRDEIEPEEFSWS